jgi:hypothetical protein
LDFRPFNTRKLIKAASKSGAHRGGMSVNRTPPRLPKVLVIGGTNHELLVTTRWRAWPLVDSRDEGYEERLRLRLDLLREEMAAGRVVFGSEVAPGIEKSLRAVRLGADGKIDLSTVNGRVRSLALYVVRAFRTVCLAI